MVQVSANVFYLALLFSAFIFSMFKKLLLLFVVTTLANGSLRAQQSLESQSFKQQLRSQYLQNDTAQAIISLYSTRQMGGAGWILGAALTAVRIASSPNRTTINGTVVRQESNAAGAVFVLPFVAYGVGKLMHYSNGKLQTILTNYAAGQPLPRSLRRKLKRRFFAQPIIKYQTVPVQPAK